VDPHDLRHVAACWMRFTSVDDAVMVEKIGHHSTDYTTKTYAETRHVNETVYEVTEDWESWLLVS